MKKLLASMFVALLMVGCGEEGKSRSDGSESNQSSAETPEAKTAQDDKINLDDNETLTKIIAGAIDDAILQTRIKGGEELQYAPDQEQPYSGWVKVYHEGGQIHALGQCKDGKKNGVEVRWYENGNKQWQRQWKDDQREGLWTGWYENGNKEGEVNLKNGKVDGLKAEWYENGNKKSEETYKEGKKDRFESWYENGNKRATSTFKNEKMMTQTRWKPNGEKCPVTNVVNGNGVVVVYEEDGTERVRLTFKNGEPVLD
jgi:antitoxin component YwqK of YwqJK toxin-antitoxin module